MGSYRLCAPSHTAHFSALPAISRDLRCRRESGGVPGRRMSVTFRCVGNGWGLG